MKDMDKDEAQERERLIMEWMRSDAAFKSLARQYGKGGRPAKLGDGPGQEHPMEREPSPAMPQHRPLAAKEEALLDWLAHDEAFKGLAKKFGRSFPKPAPKG